MKFLADIHNHTADETLGWITPIQKRTGATPDILALTQFKFYEKFTTMIPVSLFQTLRKNADIGWG
jgi:hypothetical protein